MTKGKLKKIVTNLFIDPSKWLYVHVRHHLQSVHTLSNLRPIECPTSFGYENHESNRKERTGRWPLHP